jgi:hypothetical protein
VTSLLGVMDGAQSDLRTGLPWQMVEIHEPTRLSIIVEADPDRLRRVLEIHPALERLVRNRWVWLASLDSASNTLREFRSTDFVPHEPRTTLAAVTGESAAWYQGKRGFLPPVTIVPKPQADARTGVSV